jgi:hypothetical protein
MVKVYPPVKLNKSGPIDVLEMRDPKESYRVKMDPLPDLPARGLLIGKSQRAGKTNLLANLLMLLYEGCWKPENIYIFCKTANSDHKWKKMLKRLEIPEENIMAGFSEAKAEAVYQTIVDNYNDAEADERKPDHCCVIFDDVAFDGSLKKTSGGAIDQLFCNGRHYLISVFINAQKYTQVDTTCRVNATFCIFFDTTNKEIKLIAEDHNKLDSEKAFREMFIEVTGEPHSFLLVNYNNSRYGRALYQNDKFGNVFDG